MSTFTVDIGDVAGGMDTARITHDREATTQRALHHRWTRDYLNRRFSPDEAALFADMLGVAQAPPTREPGRCSCGAELHVTASQSAGRQDYNMGMCTPCARAAKGLPSAARAKPKSAGLRVTRERLALLEAALDGTLRFDTRVGDATLEGRRVNARYEEAKTAGWVCAGPETEIRRVYFVDLTDAGRAVLEAGPV